MLKKGKIVFWNEAKGFGFIERENDNKRIFFHVSEFSENLGAPRKGEAVVYTTSIDKRSRLCAINVVPVNKQSRTRTNVNRRAVKKRTRNRKSVVDANAYWIVFTFFCLVGLSILLGTTPHEIGLFYSALSFLTFIVYAIDKSAAQNNRWRISEATLHLFSLAGGWLGALLAQKLLRHKSIKQEFRTVFIVTVLINILLLAWLHTDGGALVLGKLVSLI